MPTVWKKRSKDMIVKSGAYEREQYRRLSPLRKIILFYLYILFIYIFYIRNIYKLHNNFMIIIKYIFYKIILFI